MRRWKAVVAGSIVAAVAACGGSGSTTHRSSTTARPRASSTTSAPTTTTTTDPAAPGPVAVDLRGAASAPDTAPDGVPASFAYGSGPDQLGFVPGQQAASLLPSGFVLTGGTAWILDNVNRRFVPVQVPSGARPAPLASPDLAEGVSGLGPDNVVYLASGRFDALGLNAYALTGPRAGARVAGPSGQTSVMALQGTPLVFGPDAVTDEAGSVNPLRYVSRTGAPLAHPTVTPVPATTPTGGVARVTYRTGAGAPLRTWVVTPPTTQVSAPIAAVALPDATVAVVYYFEQNGVVRGVIARLTSKGAGRTVTAPMELIGDARGVAADATGVYLLEGTTGGFRLVRYVMR